MVKKIYLTYKIILKIPSLYKVKLDMIFFSDLDVSFNYLKFSLMKGPSTLQKSLLHNLTPEYKIGTLIQI